MAYELTQKNIKIQIFTYIFLLILSINMAKLLEADFLSIYNSKYDRIEVHIKDRYQIGSRLLYTDKVYEYKQKRNDDIISLVSSSVAYTSGNNLNGNVKLCFTDENYIKFGTETILKGSWLTLQDVRDKNKKVIISENMAVKMFHGLDVIGRKININYTEFTICGVYKNPSALLFPLADDGYVKVFVPFTCLGSEKNLQVETLFYKFSSEQKLFYYKKYIEDFMIACSGNISSYEVINRYRSNVLISEVGRFYNFIMAIMCIILIIEILFARIKKLSLEIKYKISNMYLFDLFKKEKFFLLKNILFFIVFIGGGFALYKFASFDLYIPAELIPEENIFDIGFYTDKFIKNLQGSNRGTAAYSDVYGKLLSFYMLAIIFCYAISFILLFFLKNKYTLIKNKSNEGINLIPMAIYAAGAACFFPLVLSVVPSIFLSMFSVEILYIIIYIFLNIYMFSIN